MNPDESRQFVAKQKRGREDEADLEGSLGGAEVDTWYAAYIVARERGRTPEEAAKEGGSTSSLPADKAVTY